MSWFGLPIESSDGVLPSQAFYLIGALPKHAMRLFLLIPLLIFAGLRWQDRFYPGVLRVTFLDVGQGDATLLRFPSGTVWLVDAGGGFGNWDRGKEIVAELTRLGVLTLDVAVLSHPDADHGKGFHGVWQAIRIREFWWNAVFDAARNPLFGELLWLAEKKGTALRAWADSQPMVVDGVGVQVLALPASAQTNESPLALVLSFGGHRVLLAGDAESKAERWLAQRVGPTTVLKVNHHGSATSSGQDFVSSLRPLWAVASVGPENRYGHPAAQVAHRFAQSGSRWLRTDVAGFVEFELTQKGNVVCRSAAGPCGSLRRDLGLLQLQ